MAEEAASETAPDTAMAAGAETEAETAMAGITLVHQESRRVTASISLHTFSACADSDPRRWLRPTQQLTLQFPPSLDPIGGAHGLTQQERQCAFTPCRVDSVASSHLAGTNGTGQPARAAETTSAAAATDASWRLAFMTRNGRIAGLLGQPRPYQTLTAQVVAVGGGFPLADDTLTGSTGSTGSTDSTDGDTVCIAGGIGIAPFLTMPASVARRCRLCWSIRGDDIDAISFVLSQQLLRPDGWATVTVFVTLGEDEGGGRQGGGGQILGKAAWQAQFQALQQRCADSELHLRLERRRMTADDVSGTVSGQHKVFFCGSKTLEWQIRMWCMGTAKVYCTDST